MKKLILLVFSLVGLFCVCRGQIDQEGQCDPNVGLQEGFEIEKFLGTWHELHRTANPYQQGECAAFNLVQPETTETTTTFNVVYDSVNDNFANEANGSIAVPQDGSPKLGLSLSSFPSGLNFWVRVTDYETVALTFSCENLSPTTRRVHIWVLGRDTYLPTGMPAQLINTALINLFDISLEQLEVVSHSDNNCVKLPVIESNQPILLPGTCDPNIPVVQNFQVNNFTGIWHQISDYHTDNNTGTCIRAEYTNVNGVVNVLNSEIRDQVLHSITGQATVNSNDNSAKLSVTLNLQSGETATRDLWIVGTDYKNYAVAYTCVQESTTHKRVFSWILSRSRTLSQDSDVAVNNVIDSIVELNRNYYQQTNQSDAGCFFYPEPVPNTPVVFRGQCESVNVQAMSGFDVKEFMGTWHTIELYPASSQSGTCSNAFYELTDDGKVIVVNSHVVAQELLSVNAVGALATDDGTAKLEVTFPSSPNPLLYWVLKTDYNNYAFVYSCTNINEDEMRVVSWKLSRTKELQPNAINEINAIIDTVAVLDSRYYEPMLQTTEACFYFPKPEPGVPVRFPGSCDENVGVVQNLDLNAFNGQWYEVQSYPKLEQPGQCISHNFITSGTTGYNVESTSVYDQFITPLKGVLTGSANNDGKMTLTIQNDNGTNTTIPFWVIGTDYTDYALAYSCQNDNGYRKIWSWKLSRSTTLSTSANTNINSLISNIVVLDDQYYQPVAHTESACAYLPDLEPGDEIILPGQCDVTIKGVENFDTFKYSGRWRLIESYATLQQSGTCNVAEYTYVDNNTITIVNSQVVEQQLGTVSMTAHSIDGDGKLTVTLGQNSFELIILDTDYISYALGYSCTNINENQRRIYSWKFSRQNTLSQAAITNINQIINGIEVLNNRFYYQVDRSQTGCFYYPTPDSSSLVKFRGQCSQYNNIPVQTNFNVQDYMGLWHNVESYPVTQQNGKCNNARYTLVNGTVQVQNSEVIDEALVSISGTAVQEASADNSAKLKVTFNIEGNAVTTDLWVLTTNYNDYSLAYACQDVDDEFMYVSTWKLSRKKQLDAVSIAALNNFMSDIPILDQRYFITRDHSPEACFYFPVPDGNPVVFPGKCDESISAVSQFNMQQFQGVWHEIETYPEGTRNGQCYNREFTVSGTNFNVQSSNVFNQVLSLMNTTINAPSDNSGKFSLVVPSSTDQGTMEIPYWILSTDYQNYALVYSCIQQNEDYRQVYSWKLSKSKALTLDAQAAINSTITNVVVLDNKYYEKVDQSDKACFHLPNLNPRDPVILPGKCDRTIAGVPNFDINKYSGRWRLIESYGSDFQSGTCNVAEYTEQSNNTFGVVNSQVLAQDLSSTTGTASLSSDDGSGKLLIQMSSSAEPMEYIVLDTDYTNYAFGYSCVDLDNDQRRVYSWKLSRTNELTETAISNINKIIDTIDVLHNPYYYQVDRSQTACFYYPTPDSSSLVKFRGQCSQYNNIPVQTNFNVQDYMGLWHNVESYPVTQQNGKCNNARYTLVNGTVQVQNSEVIDEALVSISGTAVQEASADNSAKLKVTFNIEGNAVTTDLWVLTTNYNDYSLAYACQDVDDEFMYVSTWKLSRKKQLDAVSIAALNNFMSDIPILDQRYFITRDHSPEACFYFPVPDGNPVVFPGKCDESISAVSQFNMQQFQGVWHEIETYPEGTRNGQCYNREFTVSGTNFNVQSSNVFNQVLSLMNTTINAPSDNSGKFSLVVPSSTGQGTMEIPYWILSTDYQNYALVYSCIQQDEDYRQVYSWKLSKSKALTLDAQAAINSTITNVVVLDNKYYEKVDQSDKACFHLPNLNPRDPVILPGKCDRTIAGIPNFDIKKYSGRWRLIESYGSDFQSGTCNVAEYTEQSNNTFGVVNSQVLAQDLSSTTGTASLSSDDGSGKLLIQMSSSAEPMEYIVLDTDYTNYAFGYSCVDLDNDQRRVYSWKLSRTNELTETAISNINKIIDTIDVLHNPYYYQVDRSQTGCFYYPTPDSSSLVKFRGQCSQYNNIPVQTNFNVQDYMGLWHNVESYPVTQQNGKCNNARYTLVDGTVQVQNSEVIDEALVSISGTAVQEASADNSAKLKVTFNIEGNAVTTDLWVLTTNYNDYSLAYACQDVDDEFMYVSTWKLSRKKQLDAISIAALNNFMSDIPILDQRYFITRDHSPEACFYFPVPDGNPVVFPGKCDESISAVSQFNMQQFQGVWHEIETYPEGTRNGQCYNREFTVSGTNFNVQSSNVFNQVLSLMNTTINAPSDNSGKFSLVVPSSTGQGTMEIPYWILSTDYQNYALVYSCIQQDEDYRQVYSWKLSKSKALTLDAQAAINSTITNVVVLDNKYYEKVDQSDKACFHLPNLNPRDPVILPGKCDRTIAGIPNFDIKKYSGRWRLIESYGSDFQSGTCNVAEYTEQSNNTFGVVNSQVLAQDLSSTTGTASLSSDDGSGKLLIQMSSSAEPMEYIVLDTDYTNYAFGYSCVDLDNDQRRVYSWKLSRTNELTETAISNINKIIDTIDVLHNPYYYQVDRSQTGCFYYPTPDSSSLVKFRGQCSQYNNIPVQTNFNVQDYMGLWHNVESYPVTQQNGKCNNARYTLVDGTVQVQNSEVIDEALVSISGTAVQEASADNSAKLKVTFNIEGNAVTTDLWVLTTNYNDYSLAYACQDVDDEFMYVSTWKLSRKKQLDAVSIAALNNFMSDIPILDQRYFITRDHSPEACFYFPVPDGNPVVFPGKCDESISAVSQFNMQQFQGVWHEIETYPEGTRNGQCYNREFTVSGTNFNVQSSNVFNQVLSLMNTTINAPSDNSGKFSLVVPSSTGQGTMEIPYWILSTDYQNYALVYSCIQQDEDYRQVYSWKLSKSKALTLDAQAAINSTITNVVVLDNKYYEKVDQSDKACFHLPNLNPRDPVILPGKCDRTIAGIPNFDIKKYSGRWRLIESYGSDFQSGTCNVAEYTEQSNNTFGVVNSQVLAQDLSSTTGTASLSSDDGSGKLLIQMSSSAEPMEYIVLDTDYTNYAFGYSCVDLDNDQRRVYSWKLSRTNELTETAISNINKIIDTIDVLHNPYYYQVDRSQTGCFYYPTPDSSSLVKFRGQCSQYNNIPVQTNFNVQDYMGLWHNVESYPVTQQNGKCNNARYTLVDGTVQVQNSEVIDQALVSISGTAVQEASADNSAKLKVTFNIEGNAVTTDLWVLTTNYNDYSLAYACQDVDDEFMYVSTWKLSRKKQLDAVSIAALNNFMSDIPILDQRYFITRDHSPEACFYFPVPDGNPVEFPGVCDENIQAMPAFDFDAFKGTWHEIQAYPKEEQPGQCISHEFTPDSTTSFLLNSFNVFNQKLSKTEGNVTYYNDNDNSGKLKIVIQSNGETITIPYWILSTDYTSYALVYSCVKTRDDYRGVFSWKLSRSKQLSPENNAIINEAMSDIDVLNDKYYENIQQTDNACFYYPVLGVNDPVIFPGRCDQNIPVFQGFEPARYLGHWRLIESYYTEFQQGTCNTATYSEGPNDTVTVHNTRVEGQQLYTITGSAVLATTDGSAKLLVTFPSSSDPADYWILDTDYTDYALIYSCEDLEDDQRRVWSWKLSRQNTLSANATEKIDKIVENINVLDDQYYQKIGRTEENCFYFPTPNPDSNVVFPGQCDQNIPVVQQFDAKKYEGQWFDLESYPTGFQSGTCNTANYVLNDDNTFDVLNTQIVNQLLQSRPGTASPTSNDGSAKFEDSFLINGELVKREYWVLATDYDNFSFVYSCRNIDEESREVNSWKLSRGKTLQAQSIQAINNVIQNVQVLDQKYYVERKHTPEDCFYYPDNNGGDVILYGTCTDDIQYMTDFKPDLFQGTWHEVSRFPSDLQEGECTASSYILDENTNTFNVLQTSVNEEIQFSTVMQATVATDGRGVITITNNGVPFDELYILDTDYEEYAVLYSCRDLDLQEERKQVYSWKLSRNRTSLSESAINAINQLVIDNIDLNEPYYRETGQDSNACFHYPELDNPDVIELPEPCNPNITGIANFNAEEYLKEWFEVARYPQLTQSGQCNRAVYSDLQGATVKVVNSQVIDRKLFTIQGTATASEDGSGSLNVNFNVNEQPTTSNYLILATDYTSYALVYSCATLENGNRKVGSWKLSRNKTLSVAAEMEIDAVVAATQGLKQDYYQSTSQEYDDCFYVPDREPLTTPRFRGQCQDVKGIQVDASQFLGWWHEIRRYESDGFAGECISSYYEQSGSTIQVIDTNVVNNTGEVTTATLTISPDGVLHKVFTDGSEQEIVVLATDYENYALLYSCENDGDDSRRVWSAVHSKSRVIDAAAEELMANLIEDNEVLYQELYLSVDQSPEVCFHYPEPTDQPIILRGQCDPIIPVVPNFNITNFEGNWYQISKYDPVQGRSCAGTRFIYNSDSEDIDIVDYYVVNEELETREATGKVSGNGSLNITWVDDETEESKSMTILVLATDYTNYAVAYSCVNVDDLRRQVSVWQLSRERQMPATGTQAIANLIIEREELYQDYFNQIPQDSECPEPSSAFLFKSSIIVILVCALLQLAFN